VKLKVKAPGFDSGALSTLPHIPDLDEYLYK